MRSLVFIVLSSVLVSCVQSPPKRDEKDLKSLMQKHVIQPSDSKGTSAVDFRSAAERKSNLKVPQTALVSTERKTKSKAKMNKNQFRPSSAKNLDMQEGENKLYQHFLFSVRTKDYPSARRAFRLLKKAYPNSQLLAEAHYQLALHAIQNSKDKLALKHLSIVIDNFPKSQRRASALLNKAEIYNRLNLQSTAKEILQHIAKQYPDSTESILAQQRMGALSKSGSKVK